MKGEPFGTQPVIPAEAGIHANQTGGCWMAYAEPSP